MENTTATATAPESKAKKMTYAELQSELDALKAKQHEAAAPKLTVKRSEKGAVSVYGLGRFPVTLYKTQWERVAEFMPEIQKFIEANKATLTSKE